jgi:hypothetical protein
MEFVQLGSVVIKCQDMEHCFEESTKKNYPGRKIATAYHLLPKPRMLDIVVMHPGLHTSVA